MQSKYDSVNKIWNGPVIPYPFKMDFMVGDLIYEKISKNPNKILQISEMDGMKMSGEDLRINSIRIAQNLIKIGITSDDVVCIFMKQTNFATYIINACIFIGAIVNPLESAFHDEDLKHILKKTMPKIIISDEEGIAKIQGILDEIGSGAQIFSASSDNGVSTSALNFLKPTNEEENFILPKFSKPATEKLMAILCSSGTTGVPKGVCITHASVLAWSSVIKEANQVPSLAYSPIYWATGFFRNIKNNISELCITTNRTFNVENFMEICEKYEVKNVTLQPSILSTLLNSEKFLSQTPKSLENFTVVGAILSKNLRTKLQELLPDKIIRIAYGMTEASGMFSLPEDYKIELSVGSLMFPNSSFKIVDDEGNCLDNGIVGEICIKPFFKFQGYYNDSEASRNAVDAEGYVKTGDMGYFDDNGMLYVIDRKKDIVKYKGYHINPSEIENVIESIKGVKHVVVVGIPDDLYTTLLAAAVVICKGHELTENDIINHVQKHLPFYKQLHGGVYFFNELPMTLSSKFAKKLVLEEIQKKKLMN